MLDEGKSTISSEFIDGIYEFSQSSFSEVAVREAKKCLIDYLAVTFAGSKMLGIKAERLLESLGSSREEITVVGLKSKTSIQNAALINGMFSHAAELDDGHRFGMFHPGSPVLSALLPVAEKNMISGEALIKGILVGYEASIRLASALQPAMKDKGYHGTGICGTIGAALGIAAAMNYSKDEMKDAMGAAATCASGIIKVIKDVSELKPFNSGSSAQNGIISAMMAGAGFKGPLDVLGGDLGFLKMMSDNPNLLRLAFHEDDLPSIFGIYRKPYAACRHCHPAIEAAIDLKSVYNISDKDIEKVHVKTYYWAVGGHDHVDILGVGSAKMSTPYSVAVALATGRAGLSEFSDEIIQNKNVVELTKKVTVEAIEELTALVPNKRAAILEIELKNNTRYTKRVDLPKGEPENPVSDQELEDKFISLALYSGKSELDCAQILGCVWNIEHDLGKLYPLLLGNAIEL
ncbi:MAG: MmgE/PrpD family protein [Flavobacterium sp.]|nr:MAG: MmgE/PrpD family protein [Flavobacterium sp.]